MKYDCSLRPAGECRELAKKVTRAGQPVPFRKSCIVLDWLEISPLWNNGPGRAPASLDPLLDPARPTCTVSDYKPTCVHWLFHRYRLSASGTVLHCTTLYTLRRAWWRCMGQHRFVECCQNIETTKIDISGALGPWRLFCVLKHGQEV